MSDKDINLELEKVLGLLRTEKADDLEQYQAKAQATSVTERRKRGVCWYPVQMESNRYHHGERILVKLSRFPEHDYPHQFASGKLVGLFSGNEQDENTPTVNAVINNVRGHEMVVTLNSDRLPMWMHEGNLGIQLLFDESAYREMETAMQRVIKGESERLIQLKRVLLGGETAQRRHPHQVALPSLNAQQNKALNDVIEAEDLAIIHGPPGTGKTTTVVEAIAYTLKQENQVLVCAPSNAAVDLLAEKLGLKGISVLRIGHPARVTDDILSLTLDAQVTKHAYYKEYKELRKKADQFRALAQKYKRNFGQAERQQRKALYDEASALRTEADQLQFFITNDLINKAQAICCTLVGANHSVLKGKSFHTVFIDEAAQALEPATWIPILKAERVVFAGDHCQLPPTVKSKEAARQGLAETLFEKAITRSKTGCLLREQYRMHQAIMQFSGQFFYGGLLIANSSVANHTIFEGDLPLEFIDTAGCGFTDQIKPETQSTYNKEEAQLVIKHLEGYLTNLQERDVLRNVTELGIIAPYKAQVEVLASLAEESLVLQDTLAGAIGINTVDSFQGQERDIIYISLTRSNDKGQIGFLADTRRMNVAITRARKKLVIIGDSATIGKHKFYDQLLDYVNEIGAYRSAFEFMDFS